MQMSHRRADIDSAMPIGGMIQQCAMNWQEDEVAHMGWKFLPVTNIPTLDSLPPAARERGTEKAASTFASTGRNLFVHYAAPILEKRRQILLSSGTRKKKYAKTASQLWPTLSHDQSFYWNQAAKE